MAPRSLLALDVFRVVQDADRHLSPSSKSGSLLSIVFVAVATIMFLNELYLFVTPDWRSTMGVSSHSFERERVSFNLSFHTFGCDIATFEALDPMTGHMFQLQQKTAQITKTRIVPSEGDTGLFKIDGMHGRVNLLPFHSGAHVADSEGCRVSGTFEIDKVPGNFMIAARTVKPGLPPRTAFTIHELRFGEDITHDVAGVDQLTNSLGGLVADEEPQTIFQFFLSVVPTSVGREHRMQYAKQGFQYTASHSTVQAQIPPGLYFRHQHTPISMEYQARYQTWSHFFVNLCAVVGGTFTVVGFAAAATDRVRRWQRATEE